VFVYYLADAFTAVFSACISACGNTWKRRRGLRFCFAFIACLMMYSEARACDQDELKYQFDIEVMTASKSLQTIAMQTATPLLVSLDLVGSVQTNAVKGTYSLCFVLNQLLDGTGLVALIKNDGVITVEKSPAKKREETSVVNQKDKTALLSSVSAFIVALFGSASTEAYAAQADSNEMMFEEIVVTAQKREQTLQDVPVAVSVVSGAVIENQALVNLSEALELVPNIDVVERQSGAQVVMRGIARSSVAVLVDGIAQGSGLSTFDSPLADVKRIEVLRGPQGSIYGRNAAGGIINYITNEPGQEFEANLSAGIGNDGFYQVSGLINAPVVEDKVALRVNGYYSHEGGYVDNVLTGENLEKTDRYGFRAQVLFTPTTDFSVRLSAQYNRENSNGRLFYFSDGPEIVNFWSETLDNVRGTTTPRVATDPFSGEVTMDGSGRRKNREYQLHAHVSWEQDWGTLMSITSYQDGTEGNRGAAFESDYGPLDILTNRYSFAFTDFTQEFRLVSNTDGKFEYLAGLYYQRTTEDERSDLLTGVDGSYILSAQISQALAAGVNASLGFPVLPDACDRVNVVPGGCPVFFDPNVFAPGTPLVSETDGNTLDTYAAFGNFTYKFNDKFHINGGARLSRVVENNTELSIPAVYNLQAATFAPFAPFAAFIPSEFGLFPGIDADREYKKTDWSGTLKASYFASDNTTAYASVTRGFRPGSIITIRTANVLENDEVDPEIIWSYEAGLKTSFLENRLLLNAAAFYVDYTNFRTFIFNDRGNVPSDGGALRNIGFEVDMIARPAQYLTLRAAIGYTDAAYQQTDGADNTVQCYENQTEAEGCVDGNQVRTGRQAENAPHWSGNVGFEYRRPINSGDWQWFLSADMTFRSSIYRSSDFDPRSLSGSNQRVNARLGFQNEKYSVILWARNLTDERYVERGSPDTTALLPGSYIVTPNRPRTFGVTAKVVF